MKLYKYEPKTIKTIEGEEVDSPFTGFVEIQVPTYKERIELLKSLNLSSKSENDIEQGLQMINLVEKHVVKVDLKSGGDKFVSLDDLGYCKEGTELINSIGTIIVQGIPLGNA